MSWKQDLDRYLTTPPEDPFYNWAENTVDKLSDKFYEKNEAWVDDTSGQFNKWLQVLFYDHIIPPEQAAKIIERAFKIYKLWDTTPQS